MKIVFLGAAVLAKTAAAGGIADKCSGLDAKSLGTRLGETITDFVELLSDAGYSVEDVDAPTYCRTGRKRC